MEPIVTTEHGQVRGRTVGGVHAFLGISYAAPPVGAYRLRPPQPVEPWSGVRDATVLGPEPPQPQFDRNDPSGMLFDPAVPGDDCLNLNVWTPDPGAGGLPVMVWSPGGAFHYSSGGSYDGSRFARDGVVCVTINWRTGADGFLYLGDGDDAANLGLRDQVAALTWVRDNISAFGGDPDRVTVFGESAGAMSIGDLLGMPRAEGLFRRAVLQSGAAHHVVPAADAARIGARLAEMLGVRATREALALVPVDRLLEAQALIDAEVLKCPDPARWGSEVVASTMPFHPVVDGDVLPAPPIDRIVAGAASDVDVLIGTNADDWRFAPVLGGFIDQVTQEALTGPAEVYGSWSIAAFGLPGRRGADLLPRPPPGRESPETCWPPSSPTGGSGCLHSGWPTRAHQGGAPPTCTSSPGPRPSWAGVSARATRWRSRSSSTPSTSATSRCSAGPSARTLPNTSPTRCIAPGSSSPATVTPDGRATSRRDEP